MTLNTPLIIKDGKRQKFEGTPLFNLIAMDYLNKKYDNHCVVVPYKKKPNDHTDVSIRWIQKKGTDGYLHVPKNFWNEFKKHLGHSHNKRFIAFPFGLTCLSQGGHANYLIYDLKTKTLERFDSLGKGTSSSCLNAKNLDQQIKDVFINEMGDDFIHKYMTPFRDYKIFQELQDNENIKKISTDPIYGFCSVWSCFWTEMRFCNPDIPRDALIALTLKHIYANFSSLTEFIRDYSQNIVRHSKSVKKILNITRDEDIDEDDDEEEDKISKRKSKRKSKRRKSSKKI